MLQGRYMADQPDLVGVVLDAHGFADLLERLSFARRVEDANANVLGAVRRARDATAREQHDLAVLGPRQRAATEAVARERDALARIGAGLRRAPGGARRGARRAAGGAARHARRPAPRRAHAARASRPSGARAAQQTAGPGGPWAIPWPVVQCESGGQNLPPNSAGASGYYQMLDATWRAWAAARRTPTRRPRPSRTAWRPSCGTAAAARATGSAPRSSAP